MSPTRSELERIVAYPHVTDEFRAKARASLARLVERDPWRELVTTGRCPICGTLAGLAHRCEGARR